MAAQKTVKAKSSAQVAAGKAYASAGRSAQAKARAAGKGQSKAQKAATVKWQKAGARASRAAAAARRAGKAYVPAKKPAAPAPDTWTRFGVRPGEVSLHQLPVCAAVAVAEHLAIWTGAYVPDESVLALHEIVQPATLADVLEYAAAEGFPGTGEKLAHFERCDPGFVVPGLIYGIQLPEGYHAVVARSSGMTSWGQIMPLAGEPEEAWWLEWED